MCGIAGVFRRDAPIGAAERAALARMLSALGHRGPDGEGTFEEGPVLLGHRRLAVIDLSDAAKQPMANETEDVWLAFNGEIYNFRELRSELERSGHLFRSATDAEVLVHGYEAWGVDRLLERLRGMFAFALLDRRREREPRLYLARDRFGIKPLYYARLGHGVVFASELSAIVASGLVETEPSSSSLAAYLALGSVPAPETALEGVSSLLPGHLLELEAGQPPKGPRRYYELDFGARDEGSDIAATLRDAVRSHLVSDVPLGCFLSGGIDSASLVALASAASERPLTTLSLAFDDPGLDESRYAREVAERYHTEHHEVRIGSDQFRESLPDVWKAMDQPTVDGVNAFLVSRAAKEVGLTVVLTGLGGDEVFLGYPHFRKIRRLAPWLRWARGPLGALSGRWPRLDYLRDPGPGNLWAVFRGLFAPREIEALLPGTTPPPIESQLHDPLDAAVELELRLYLHNQLLRDTDAMSMAHSIEARVPFLDHRLVEAAMRVPHEEKLHGKTNKPLLLGALDETLPRAVWDRPKQGFTLPFQHRMKEHRNELLERTLAAHTFDENAVRGLWSRFDAGRAHWSRPWALVAYAAWLEKYRSLVATERKHPSSLVSTHA